MARERRRPGAVPEAPTEDAARTRPRGTTPPAELELSPEELRALADEGVDPDEAQRVAREAAPEDDDVSEHDRDTARDVLEGVVTPDEDY